MTYDAVVVGARCAGASTAMLLARGGLRVLLCDRVAFPCDTVSNGMFILGYATGIIYIVTGVILLLAATFDTIVRQIQIRSGR